MTTTTLAGTIAEHSAVETAATFDTTRGDYAHAARIALARRGTRDALIVALARARNWDTALAALTTITPTSEDIEQNLDATLAAIHWAKGDTGAARTIAARHPGHRMNGLIIRLLDADVPAEAWFDRMAAIDIDACYAFEA